MGRNMNPIIEDGRSSRRSRSRSGMRTTTTTSSMMNPYDDAEAGRSRASYQQQQQQQQQGGPQDESRRRSSSSQRRHRIKMAHREIPIDTEHYYTYFASDDASDTASESEMLSTDERNTAYKPPRSHGVSSASTAATTAATTIASTLVGAAAPPVERTLRNVPALFNHRGRERRRDNVGGEDSSKHDALLVHHHSSNSILMETHGGSNSRAATPAPPVMAARKDATTHLVAGDDGEEEEEIYIVRQNVGYLAITFSLVQTIILGLMMWQCGIAPLKINPMLGPYPDALSEWGGKNSYLILDEQQWYRLFTPILLHAGLIHLFCNIAVQLDTGVFFEKEWGSFRWLLIYLSSAVGSSVLSVIRMPNAVSVGSSGAVMGLFGGKLAEVLLRACDKTETEQDRISHQVRKEQCVGVTCSVTVVMLFSFIPYVDWAAHLGGLAAGFLVGMWIFSCDVQASSNCCCKFFWFLTGMVLSVCSFAYALDYMYQSGEVQPSEQLKDVCGYYQEYYPDYECRCMRDEYNSNRFNNNNAGGAGAQRNLYEW